MRGGVDSSIPLPNGQHIASQRYLPAYQEILSGIHEQGSHMHAAAIEPYTQGTITEHHEDWTREELLQQIATLRTEVSELWSLRVGDVEPLPSYSSIS